MAADSPGSAPGDAVLRRVEDGVAWITLNRPEAGNAITAAMRDQVVVWLEEASADLAVRVVVLTGAGEKAFCTGADLRSSGPGLPRPEGAPDRAVGDAARLIRTGWQRLVSAVLDCEKPVIAAVNATAAGGGMHLALACDLVLAAEESKFIEVFIRRGIAPDAGGAYLLARLVGPQKAKELFFFGDDVPAREAERMGLVNKVVPRADLLEEAASWAARLAAEEATFIEVFIRRGIAPDAGGAYLLARLVGPQKAKELFFFGDDVPAREAERLGLVNKVVPRADLLDEAAAWAARLALAPTKAIGVAKYLTNRALDTDRATALWDEAVGQELVTGTEDCKEGLAAFAERRPPVFRGW